MQGHFYLDESAGLSFAEVESCLKRTFQLTFPGLDSYDNMIPNHAEHLADLMVLWQLRSHPWRTNDSSAAIVHVTGVLPFASFLASTRVPDCMALGSHTDRMRSAAETLQRKLTSLQGHPQTRRIYVIVNTDWECTDTLGKPMLDFLSSNLGREHVYYATSDMGFASKNCRGHNIAGNSIIIPYVATHVIDQAAQNPDNLCNASTRTISFYFAGDLIRTDQGHYRKDVLNAMASQGSDAQVLHRRFRSVTDYHQMALEYRDNLLRSRYCLVPAGDTPTSRRLFDALAAGCIPVYLGSPKLLADEVPGVGESNLPFPRTLEWSSFVILRDPWNGFTKEETVRRVVLAGSCNARYQSTSSSAIAMTGLRRILAIFPTFGTGRWPQHCSPRSLANHLSAMRRLGKMWPLRHRSRKMG